MPRANCDKCLRPSKLCYCSKIRPINNRINVTIIQHPKESKHPFNTGRLAHRCLVNSQLLIQEQLSETQIQKLLTCASAILYPNMPWLPETQQLVIENNQNGETVQSGDTQLMELTQHLVVLDATWRKSKRMMFEHEALQQLPRICLTGDVMTNYRVRKSRIRNSLCSLESIYFALTALEPNNDFANLLEVFEKMVSSQESYPTTLLT